MPHQNVLDLMLPQRDRRRRAAPGRFHVFAVEHVTDALEIALGAPMATIDARVRARLATFADALPRRRRGDRPPSGAAVAPPSTPLPDPQAP